MHLDNLSMLFQTSIWISVSPMALTHYAKLMQKLNSTEVAMLISHLSLLKGFHCLRDYNLDLKLLLSSASVCVCLSTALPPLPLLPIDLII